MSELSRSNIPDEVHSPPTTQGRVFVLGSSNVDLIAYVPRFPRAGETLFGHEFETKFGGKGANQAVAAAKLGARVIMLTMIGTDNFGDNYQQEYRKLGVDTSLVLRTDEAATGIASIAVDGKGENCIIVVPGANACLTAEVALGAACIADKLSACSVLVMQNEVPAATNAAIMAEAAARGLITIFNAAPATNLEEPYRSQLLSGADVVCVNEEEATALTGRSVESDDDVDAAAAALLEVMGGDGFVLLTLGKRGCAVYGAPRREGDDGRAAAAAAEMSRAPAAEVAPDAVVDTVGAGDAFVGAVATHLAARCAQQEASGTAPSSTDAADCGSLRRQRRALLAKQLPIAAARANLVAGASVQRKGAQASFPEAAEVPAFFSSDAREV